MSFVAKCTRTCTTPQHGMVEIGETKVFEGDAFDIKKFSFLKHFAPVDLVGDDEPEEVKSEGKAKINIFEGDDDEN